MANGNPAGPDNKPIVRRDHTKRAYSKPTFRFERVFETQALSCGKIGSTSTQCKLSKKASCRLRERAFRSNRRFIKPVENQPTAQLRSLLQKALRKFYGAIVVRSAGG
jgi:hypothetical protein